MRKFLSDIGSSTISFLYFLGGLANLSARTIYWTFLPPFKWQRFLEEAKKAGVDSLPIVTLVSLFIGIILALQSAYQLQRLGSEMYIASLVALSLVRELGPVITALVVAGRVGAAIAAPTRPATTNAVITGPSSRTRESATRLAIYISEPSRCS